MNLLLLSNSTQHGRGYLEHALDTVTGFLPAGARLAFVPYALADHDTYTARVRSALADAGIDVRGVPEGGDPLARLDEADAVFVGGGNSFRLLSALYRTGLREALVKAVRGGLPYMGASAGTNMAAPSLRTTNDMPIVEPPSFETLGLVPFQINPHYLDPDPGSTHKGETREERLREFLEENDVPVLGLREGSWLRVEGDRAVLGGERDARLFRRGTAPRELAVGSDLSELLEVRGEFDTGTRS
ncbi:MULTISPECIES: dipeptidase PepE [Streptomyces]|uniref:dipeptidase PepE n=1 Tax=Streptomyces TaxID=1883 RepID=UPI00087BF187|nr:MULTISPECIES: dipeptidase PepE [Streptomyces]REH18893.1 alpha-aspartyl dipeptidase [Streptomyces sp. 2221.1]THA99786.1 dipeptidase PepE [Streptomyces sp. LRa12]WTE22883.1 dipeptidase PepE [Streptomyces anthocyanicus]SDS51610.1 alpha-aspartyl dipeptidase. Serine peptidase. MEROPS family S51 [Streptomyces sp. 2114.2]GGL75409.1 peptidase E [Streptomyces anthocyanicus]